MILVGDTIHNFVDGILIAAAFLADIQLGIVTALAMIAHEMPQEVGDFLILLNSGYSRGKPIAFNLLSSVATLVGGLLAYVTLHRCRRSCRHCSGSPRRACSMSQWPTSSPACTGARSCRRRSSSSF